MGKRLHEISRFFVGPPRVFPLPVHARPRTSFSTNTSALVCGSLTSQASSPWAKQHRAKPISSWRNHIQCWIGVWICYCHTLEKWCLSVHRSTVSIPFLERSGNLRHATTFRPSVPSAVDVVRRLLNCLCHSCILVAEQHCRNSGFLGLSKGERSGYITTETWTLCPNRQLLMQPKFLPKLTGSPLFVGFLRRACFLRGNIVGCVMCNELWSVSLLQSMGFSFSHKINWSKLVYFSGYAQDIKDLIRSRLYDFPQTCRYMFPRCISLSRSYLQWKKKDD